MTKEPMTYPEIVLAEIEIKYAIERRHIRTKFAVYFTLLALSFAGRIIAPEGSTLFLLAGWVLTALNLFIAYTSIENCLKLRKMEKEESFTPVSLKRMIWVSLGIAAVNIALAVYFFLTEVV